MIFCKDDEHNWEKKRVYFYEYSASCVYPLILKNEKDMVCSKCNIPYKVFCSPNWRTNRYGTYWIRTNQTCMDLIGG
jgi:hypothetical protein